ncbi:dihydropteroate synthase [Thalassotalea eurytherma]|uniref:Dihydropteroate synthase n=1 Tax=Thalassotalea eurytherma TaxID=1144278 RepID=A0ABQ6H331_9GAMM|nr:dihydropteroate synthase [Thalassotalea eurytherma]GLX82593.1 dihydropteroate synthase [Thalassotalea eurytherma]
MNKSFIDCPNQRLDLSQPQVMGILNVTPDSFSDGGKFFDPENALAQVKGMIEGGATIIDVGGESTRPGAADVSVEDELNRVIPVVKAIKQHFQVIVSVDTSKAQVMEQSILAGADIINDVRALQNEGCVAVMAKYPTVPVCIMHMQGLPRTMQNSPRYDDVVDDIKLFFVQRLAEMNESGIDSSRVVLDPGFGFGKTLEQNYQLLGRLSEFEVFNLPVLVGMSRKSMIGNLLKREVNERLAGSITTAVLAAQQGAKIIRVHDVQETVDALKVLAATQQKV